MRNVVNREMDIVHTIFNRKKNLPVSGKHLGN